MGSGTIKIHTDIVAMIQIFHIITGRAKPGWEFIIMNLQILSDEKPTDDLFIYIYYENRT
jgi:hypothetical protein